MNTAYGNFRVHGFISRADHRALEEVCDDISDLADQNPNCGFWGFQEVSKMPLELQSFIDQHRDFGWSWYVEDAEGRMIDVYNVATGLVHSVECNAEGEIIIRYVDKNRQDFFQQRYAQEMLSSPFKIYDPEEVEEEPVEEHLELSNLEIKVMVDRFLAWQLPRDFDPDGGIFFEREREVDGDMTMPNTPVGTNLLNARQAEEMVRHMVRGLK